MLWWKLRHLTEDSERGRGILRFALSLAAIVWFISLLCCLIAGGSLIPSVGEATLASGGSFLAWAIYRELSGRYDGLLPLFLASMAPIRQLLEGNARGPAGTIIMVIVLLIVSPIMARIARLRDLAANQQA
jgi:hypothetical protein